MEDSNHQFKYLENSKGYHFNQGNTCNQSLINLRFFLTWIVLKQFFTISTGNKYDF